MPVAATSSRDRRKRRKIHTTYNTFTPKGCAVPDQEEEGEEEMKKEGLHERFRGRRGGRGRGVRKWSGYGILV